LSITLPRKPFISRTTKFYGQLFPPGRFVRASICQRSTGRSPLPSDCHREDSLFMGHFICFEAARLQVLRRGIKSALYCRPRWRSAATRASLSTSSGVLRAVARHNGRWPHQRAKALHLDANFIFTRRQGRGAIEPSALVVSARLKSVVLFVIVTVALGMTAPTSCFTMPDMFPVGA
jgi:hypothetical protein